MEYNDFKALIYYLKLGFTIPHSANIKPKDQRIL